MKIEMGESLLYSWLRHIKMCQVVQNNWKVSAQWNLSNTRDLESLMEQANKYYYQKYRYSVFKQNTSLLQLLHQGECDVLGISILPSGTKYYAADVAFHEAGLNYGGRDTTVMKVIEKCIRTAFCLHGYFSTNEAEIIFASPKINTSVLSILIPCIEELNLLFTKNAFDFVFRIIANDEFNDIILKPTLSTSDEIADTSELFLRSYQLVKIFSDNINTSNAIKPRTTYNEMNNLNYSESDEYHNYKVGEIANIVLRSMLQNGYATDDEIVAMQTAEYSKKQFGIQHPLLKRATEEKMPTPKYYYAPKIVIKGIYYWICNDWYEASNNNDRPYLLKWIKSHKR